jgi:hypothetical protein
LQRVAVALPVQVLARERSQLVVDERQERSERGFISGVPPEQQLSDIATRALLHGGRYCSGTTNLPEHRPFPAGRLRALSHLARKLRGS